MRLAALATMDGANLTPKETRTMSTAFKVGDHVGWNSEAGHVSGRITAIHTQDFDWKGYHHRASPDDPQYEIESDKTDHGAVHKGAALRRLGD